MHPAAGERSRRPSNPAEAALAAATEAVAAVKTPGVQRIATPQFETPDLWSVHVDVRLPNSQHAVGVRLKVHTAGQITLEWPSFGGLQPGQSALKLAVVLGKQAMVRHILRRRLKIAWTWGPVTQYMFPLEEIDTADSSKLSSLDTRQTTLESNE